MAEDFATSQQQIVMSLADQLKVTPILVSEKVSQLLEERKTLERETQTLRQRLATSGGGETVKPQMIGDVALYKRHLKDIPPQDLKSILDELKSGGKSGIFAVVSEGEGKVSFVIGVSSDLLPRYNAVDLIRKVVAHVGGKGGGGRPDLAQAGGPNQEGIEELFKELSLMISQT
jgi:alanyl-tRNA synthetase